MPKWCSIILAVALIACASADQEGGGGDGEGKRGGGKPQRETEGNQGNLPPGRTPPPLSKENKTPGNSRQGAPEVERSGRKEDKKYVMSSGGFNIEINGGVASPPTPF